MGRWRLSQKDMTNEYWNDSNPIIVCIIGMAGVGKDYFLNKLLEYYPNLHKVISITSRPMRPGEEEGKEYFFKTKEEFEEMINNNELIEHREFRGWLYGTPISSIDLDKVNVTIGSPDGFFNIKKFFEQYQDIEKVIVVPLVLLAPEDIRKERYYSRVNGEKPLDDWGRRNAADIVDHNIIAEYINHRQGPSCYHENVKPVEKMEDIKWFGDWIGLLGQDIVNE